ncbi:MAG: hypothetical protein ACM3S1_10990 [Hyphomicrobiales bacterium]
MKVLSIGYPLPNMHVDNYNVLTAPSYFDYDALVIDPASITRVVAELLEGAREFEAHDGRPVLNAPTTASVVSAADQVRRRGEETQRLLEAGGVVVVLGRPNATQAGLSGFEGCDRYSWLPAPAGMTWGSPNLRPAEGKSYRLVADDHPIAAFLREYRSGTHYRAVFDDRQPGVRQGRVLAVANGNVPVAMSFEVLGGTVIFVPVLTEETGPQRSRMAEALVDTLTYIAREATPEQAPYWARTVAVPGLEQVEAELEEAEAELAAASERVATVRERHDRLASHRRLLTEDGPAFTLAVADALSLLGFARVSAAGEPLAVESEGRTAFVECEGSRETVVEWPYVRLQRRLEERLLKQGDQLKGVVVVNGERVKEPEQRGQEFTGALRIACENYRYCLLTGSTMFALMQRALGGADEATLTGIRRRILSTNGLLELEAALGEVEEESDTGPIF